MDDLFDSFDQKPPPPSSAHPAASTRVDPSKPLGNSTAASNKRPLSPASEHAPVDQEALKKLKTDETGRTEEGTAVIGGAGEDGTKLRDEHFVATDEMEITAKTTVKASAGLAGGEAQKDGEEEGLVLQHQVRRISFFPCGNVTVFAADCLSSLHHSSDSDAEPETAVLTPSSRSGIKSLSRPTTPTFPSLRTFLPPNPHAPIRSSSTHSKKFRSPRFSETSRFSSRRTRRQARRSLPSTRSRNA